MPRQRSSYRALLVLLVLQSVTAQLGKKVRLVQLEGKEHDIFLDPAVFAELATMLQ